MHQRRNAQPPVPGQRALLIALASVLGLVMQATAYTSSSTGKRWALDADGSYNTDETYTDVLGNSETYRMQWELYEGSIAITQMALVWKEISQQTDLQLTRLSTSAKTTEVLRIRRIWQLESKGASLSVYDDENELGEAQVVNDFANMEYVNPAPQNGNEWFAGDVVPFERCAYIVNMNSDGATKYYRFIQIQTAVRWDPILKYKLVVTQQNHVSDEYTQALDTVNDIPVYHVEMGYWPIRGSFFYFNQGYMHLKHDATADMTDMCDDADNRCDRSGLNDPCSREYPLFPTGSTLYHQSYQVSTDDSETNHAIAYEAVFDSIFVIFANDDQKIFRIGGEAYNSLQVSDFFFLGQTTGVTYTAVDVSTAATVTQNTISTICSMDFFGLFLGITGETKPVRLELEMDNDGTSVFPAQASIVKDGNNLYNVININYFEMDAQTDTFRLLQTKGYYGRHRPCYMVTADEPTQLKRLTTQITVFFPTTMPDTNKIDLFTTDWSEGAVKQGAQLLRFHLFNTMPGQMDATNSVALADLDYDMIRAFIYDIRAQTEWGKFPLTSAGDGVVSAEFGEECDPLQLPPIMLTHDEIVSTDADWATANAIYPDSSYAAQITPAGKVSWIPADTIEDTSGDTGRTQYMAEGYYTCTSAAFLTPYNGCGDGVPSNGPIWANTTDAAGFTFWGTLNKNQRNGTSEYEWCDDGNNNDGDGCKGDCSEIEDGWECTEWGAPCTYKCGNGHIEGVYTLLYDTDGVTPLYEADGVTQQFTFEYELGLDGLAREECDMGAFNSPRSAADTTTEDIFKYACTSDCKLIQSLSMFDNWDPDGLGVVADLWTCALEFPILDAVRIDEGRLVVRQKCTYQCGNKVLDTDETCDIGEHAFLSMDSQTGYMDGTDVQVATTDVEDWFTNNLDDPKVNQDMSLGCSRNCQAITITNTAADGSETIHHFVFPDDAYDQLGSDRCGDGIMDGPVTYTDTATGTTYTIRATENPTPRPQDPYFSPGSCLITGYCTSYYPEVDYAARMRTEQCDNGGDTDHGCDRMCQVVSGWTCYHYYHHLLGVEQPQFTSICEEDALPTLSSRRRLSPSDFDKQGRFLSHLPRKAYLYKLPENAHIMRSSKHTISFEHESSSTDSTLTSSLNGQVRILESKHCTSCYGFTMGYQRDAYTDSDYWYRKIYAEDAGATLGVTSTSVDMVTQVLNGKQRNTFGPYMVVNKNLNEIDIYGYASTSPYQFSLLYTIPAEQSVQYVGSHEFYWFPYKELLMAKLSDGSSFKLFRMSSEFRTTATDTNASTAMDTSKMIDSGEFRLFHVPGRTMISPLFWGKLAYFYVSGTAETSTPKLIAYQWNDLTNEFEEKCTADLDQEGSTQSLYHKYTFVNMGDDGVVFSVWATGTFRLYKCTPDPTTVQSFTITAVTIDNSNGAVTGYTSTTYDGVGTDFESTAMTLIQPREDPDNYASGTVLPVYGLYQSSYIQKLSWTSPTFTMDAANIAVPTDKDITVSPEHLDVGRQWLVLLQPADCAAEHDSTLILNAGVQFYDLTAGSWTCLDLDDIKTTMDVTETAYWDHYIAPPYR